MNASIDCARKPTAYWFVISVLAVLLVSPCIRVHAQQAAPSPGIPPSSDSARTEEQDTVIQLDAFVVSGTVSPRRKLESAAAITTIDMETMKMAAPKAGPDLMKLVPGVYVESAGGEGRANVYTRGIPQAGGYIFAGLQEDGMGALSETGARGVAPDLLTRLTGLVAKVESVRGGTAGVFMNNAPGGIINFINREGTQVRQGEISLQTSDYNQIKSSLWMSGPVNPSTTYAFALDYRKDDGQRDLGFPANVGGGIVANLKHEFKNERGSIKITGKWLDEANAFYVPIPLKNAQDPQTIPGGPDILRGFNYSADLRHGVSLAETPDGPQHPDLADGGHPRMWYIGTDLDLKLAEGLKLRNISRYTDLDYVAGVTILGSVATPLQSLANSIGSGAGTQFAAARVGANYSYRLVYPGSGEVVTTPSTLNGNGLGLLQNLINQRFSIQSIQNDFRLQKTTAGGGGVSLGLYVARLEAEAHAWAYTMVTEVRDLPRRIDIEYLDATTGASIGYGTYNGMRQASNAAQYRNNSTKIDNVAPYLNVEQTWRNWTFDAGVRHEWKDETVTTAVTQTYNLNPAGQNNPALRNATFGNGTFYTMNYKTDATVWTASANYKFTNRFSAYARFVSAYRMPNTEDILTQVRARNPDPGPTNHIKQFEAGVKYSTRKISVFASVIGSRLTNQLFAGNIAQPDGSLVPFNFYRDTEGAGIEVEAFYTPIKPLTFHFVGTHQKTEFASDATVTGLNSSGQTVAVNIKGNRPVRIPDTFFTANAAYKFPEMRLGRLTANVDWEYVGERAGDEANRTTLPAYSQIAAGLSLKSGRLTYRVQAQNLFDEAGITEGDPRTALFVGDPNAAYLNARTIGPRSVIASVTFEF
jgi:outer membrane cobalamin receptor